MRSPIPTADLADIWEPAENVQADGGVFTPTYARAQADVTGNFRPLTATQRAMSGLDLTADACRLFLYGTLQKPSNRCIAWHVGDGTAWAPLGPATYHQTIVSPGHFQIVLVRVLSPPAEIAETYT